MRALLMMLFNTTTKKYHPILYFESPLPSYIEGDEHSSIRFKSAGHRTKGLKSREAALESIDIEIVARMTERSYYEDLDGDLQWDGSDVPADIQLRDATWLKTHMKDYFKISNEDDLKSSYAYIFDTVVADLKKIDISKLEEVIKNKTNDYAFNDKIHYAHNKIFYDVDPANPDSLSLIFNIVGYSSAINSLSLYFEGGVK